MGETPVIQDTSPEAVHAHSGSVVTRTVPAPPAASIPAGAFTETPHFSGAGPVIDSVDVDPHAAVATAATTSHIRNRRRSIAGTIGATMVEQSSRHCVELRLFASVGSRDPERCREARQAV